MSASMIRLDGRSLTRADVAAMSEGAAVSLAPEALKRVAVRDAKGSPFNLYHAILAVRLAQEALSTPGKKDPVHTGIRILFLCHYYPGHCTGS